MDEILTSGTAQLKKAFQEKKDEIAFERPISAELFTEFVLAHDPRYNNPKGYERITKAYYCYLGDLNLLDMLKAYQLHA
jgi:hypothetical protein